MKLHQPRMGEYELRKLMLFESFSILMGKGFVRSLQRQKQYKKLVNPQMMAFKALIKSMYYHMEQKIPLSETRHDFGKDRHNAYDTSISMSFMSKYLFDKQ